MRPRLVGLIALVLICGMLHNEPAEAGRRKRCCNPGNYACVPQAATCSVQSATCCTPRPKLCCPMLSGCNPSCCAGYACAPTAGRPYFCQSSETPSFFIGGIPFYPGMEYPSATTDCDLVAGTPVTYCVDNSGVHDCPDPGNANNDTPQECNCVRARFAPSSTKLPSPLDPHINTPHLRRKWGVVLVQKPHQASADWIYLELLDKEYDHPKAGTIPAQVGAEVKRHPHSGTLTLEAQDGYVLWVTDSAGKKYNVVTAGP